MALVRLGVTPTSWLTVLAAIADDGNDYDVAFDGGTYTYDGSLTALSHRSGGLIRFRARPSGSVTVTTLPTSQGGVGHNEVTPFRIEAQQVQIYGFNFVGQPYHTTAGGTAYYGLALNIGSLGSGSTRACDPTLLDVANCTMTGMFRMHLGISGDPTIYTTVKLRNLTLRDVYTNGAMHIRPALADRPLPPADNLTSGGYAHVLVDRIDAIGVNGPDGPFWSINNPTTSSHSEGTAPVETTGLTGSSSFTMTSCTVKAQMHGSLNHDSHCFRANDIRSHMVRHYFRDCFFSSDWIEGYADGDGGGLTHLFYYHGGGYEFGDGLGQRPRFDFVNCTFDGKFRDTFLQLPTLYQGDPNRPLRQLFNCNSAADYHLWDCRFTWDLPAAWLAQGDIYDIRINSDEVGVVLHSSTRDANAITQDLSGFTGTTLTTDQSTQGYRDDNWQRFLSTEAIPSRGTPNLILDPSGEAQSSYYTFSSGGTWGAPGRTDAVSFVLFQSAPLGGPSVEFVVPTVDGKFYRFDFWYNPLGVSLAFEVQLWINNLTLSPLERTRSADIFAPDNVDAWHQYHGWHFAPNGPVHIRLLYDPNAPVGTFWVLDDLAVTEIESL